jgi:hypothetical protein
LKYYHQLRRSGNARASPCVLFIPDLINHPADPKYIFLARAQQITLLGSRMEIFR